MFKFLKKKSLNLDQSVEVSKTGIKPVVLLVLDGFGIAPPSNGNAVTQAKTPNLDKYKKIYPNGQLIASGESVGLPAGEEGNSEVGHLTMGTGRPILQSLPRINKAIEDGEFFNNEAFLKAIDHIKANGSSLHIAGLVGSGDVHSSTHHLYALLELCKRKSVSKLYLHLFTDGRDAPPKEGKSFIVEIQKRLDELKMGQIATIAGRYYAMDRDLRWERVQKIYDAMTLGKGVTSDSAEKAMELSYANGKTDEFVEPTVILKDGKPVATVNDKDAFIFFNFRIDRPRELSMAFVIDNFEHLKGFSFGHDPHKDKYEAKSSDDDETYSGDTFRREKVVKDLFFVTMTEYIKIEHLPVSEIAFPPETVDETAGKVISDNHLKQLRIAESEKERMVTYYFNGMKDVQFEGEDRHIIPSPKVATYDKKPEMSVHEVVDYFLQNLRKNQYSFYMMNFANTDMVAHTGDLKASIKAVEIADREMGRVIDATVAAGGTVIMTADHGNVEELVSFPVEGFYFTTSKGSVNTSHSSNPVPVIIANKELENKPIKLPSGSLADIAPTILSILKLPVPSQMIGKNLLNLQNTNSNLQ